MPRGLTSAVKTELATGKIRPVLLIEIGFSTPVYLTDASFDITSSISGSSRTIFYFLSLFLMLFKAKLIRIEVTSFRDTSILGLICFKILNCQVISFNSFVY